MSLDVSCSSCRNGATCTDTNPFSTNNTCLCPAGFTGDICTQRACGSPFGGELIETNATCTCDQGFTGVNCQLCTSDEACNSQGQSNAALTVFSTSSSSSSNGESSVQNSEYVCSQSTFAYSSGTMSCPLASVALIQQQYPGQGEIYIARNTSTKTLDTYFYWYNIEQLHCHATECIQSRAPNTNANEPQDTSIYSCSKTTCDCLPYSSWCSNVTSLNLARFVDNVQGEMNISCIGNACAMSQPELASIFTFNPNSQFTMSNCSFGECVSRETFSTGSSFTADIIVVIILLALILVTIIILWTKLKFQQSGLRSSPIPPIRLGANVIWKNVSYNVKIGGKQREILKVVSGYAHRGQFVGVLGPTGAGKTTLIDILSGRSKAGTVSGEIYFNGDKISPDALRKRVGFVGQDDLLPPLLTVKECLMFAATLKLPEGMPITVKARRVDEVLKQLSLTSVQNTRVGNTTTRGISGGEKRRLSIALELVAAPEVLVFDEAITGLDSKTAKDVIDNIRKLCRSQLRTTVIMTVHQPRSDIFHAMDAIVLVAGGYIIYHGPPDYATEYFERFGHQCPVKYNPADFLLDVAQMPPGNNPSSHPVRMEGLEKDPNAEIPHYSYPRGLRDRVLSDSYPAAYLTQFQSLCGRELKTMLRDPYLLLGHFSASVILGLSLGGLYYQSPDTLPGIQNRLGVIFFFLAVCAFSAVSTIGPFYREKYIFVRERAGRYYAPLPWIFAHVIFDLLPLRILPSIVMVTIIYWMSGLNPAGIRYVKMLAIVSSYSIGQAILNMLLSSIFYEISVAVLLAALTSLYQLLFAGYAVHLRTISVVMRWLQWLAMSKYALEALSANEFAGRFLNESYGGAQAKLPEATIVEVFFGFDLRQYWRDEAIILGYNLILILALVLWIQIFIQERK